MSHPEGLIIYGYSGSTAEEYANEHGIPFVIYKEKHNLKYEGPDIDLALDYMKFLLPELYETELIENINLEVGLYYVEASGINNISVTHSRIENDGFNNLKLTFKIEENNTGSVNISVGESSYPVKKVDRFGDLLDLEKNDLIKNRFETFILNLEENYWIWVNKLFKTRDEVTDTPIVSDAEPSDENVFLWFDYS